MRLNRYPKPPLSWPEVSLRERLLVEALAFEALGEGTDDAPELLVGKVRLHPIYQRRDDNDLGLVAGCLVLQAQIAMVPMVIGIERDAGVVSAKAANFAVPGIF